MKRGATIYVTHKAKWKIMIVGKLSYKYIIDAMPFYTTMQVSYEFPNTSVLNNLQMGMWLYLNYTSYYVGIDPRYIIHSTREMRIWSKQNGECKPPYFIVSTSKVHCLKFRHYKVTITWDGRIHKHFILGQIWNKNVQHIFFLYDHAMLKNVM